MTEQAKNRQAGLSRRKVLQSLGLGGLTTAASAPAGAELLTKKAALVRRRKVARQRSWQSAESGGPVSPGAAVIALNRMGFGPRPGDVEEFNALGATDQERLAAYVAQQLDPASINDANVENKIANAGYESVGLDPDPDIYLAILWDWYVNDNAPNGNTSSTIPRNELIRVLFMRAMYSKRQLLEVMVEFWRDHFNTYEAISSWVRVPLPHLDFRLREEALGNFRAMLEQVAMAPSMLRYLDNYTSSNAGPNENFNREMFEVMTLGTENYLGILPQSEVPTDGNGIPIGYVDADVFESTRAFTGWSFSNGTESDDDTGLFLYRSTWHDRFQKNVLGVFIPQDQGDLKDGRDVLDALASHPGTGRYIARKLCRRLIADDPPQSVIDAAAAVFTAQWQAPDQLRQVIEVILLSPEFLATWGEKSKRPFEIAVSAFRAADVSFTMRMTSDIDSFISRFDKTGHELFDWPAPNGYPDDRNAWNSMTPRVMSWRMANWLIDFDDDNDEFYLDIIGQTPGSVRSANEIADFWIDRVLGRPMEPDDRDEIVDFMANGFNPDFDLDFGDDDTVERLRSMVGLLFMSPDFLWR